MMVHYHNACARGIVGIGTDIVRIQRFRSVARHARIASFFLTEKEWQTVQNTADVAQTLASRFAAKEAVIKALPVPIKPLDFEITKRGVKPEVSFLIDLPYMCYVSIAHEQDVACAISVCMELLCVE